MHFTLKEEAVPIYIYICTDFNANLVLKIALFTQPVKLQRQNGGCLASKLAREVVSKLNQQLVCGLEGTSLQL